jgi:vesicle coat complex subunit
VATPEDTEQFLLETLRQAPDKDLRRLAAKRLVQGALSPPAITGLIAAFKDAEADVRNEAIKSLVAIGKPAVPQLVEALRHADAQVRRRAVTTLGQLNRLAGDAVPDLQECLQDADPEVRNLASAALRLIQGQ